MASSAMRTETPLDLLDLDDLLARVRAARRTHPMRHLRIPALRTPVHRRHLGLHRAAALPLPLLRNFPLRYRHTSSSFGPQAPQRGPPRVLVLDDTVARGFVQIRSAPRTQAATRFVADHELRH